MKFKNRKQIFLTVIFICSLTSPFIFFSIEQSPWSGSSFVKNVFQEIIYPFEYTWHATSSFVVSNWRHYFALSKASKENDELKRQLAFQKTRIMAYEERLLEIERLRKLLGFAQNYEQKLLAAEVVGNPTSLPFQTIRLTRGRLDNVEPGMPVVTSEGIVGRVLRTGIKFSDVQLIIDSNFNLDVLLQRTRVRGVLTGNGESGCVLNLTRRADVRIGDTIITSGIVGGFPKGLSVGFVRRISYASDNVSQTINVEPWIDYRRLEEVFVLQSVDQDLLKIVDTAGSEWLEKSTEWLVK